MREIFQKRRQVFIERCIKYSRYVLNDHFVLVLLVFLGFLSLQYRNLLEKFPENPWPVYLALATVSIVLFMAGRTATFIEEADQHFLLTKERDLVNLVKEAGNRQFFFWGSVQLLGQVLLLPLYLKSGLPIWGFIVFISLLTAGKYYFIQRKQSGLLQAGIFQWQKAIDSERKRQQTILQFFALFTNVKGITSSVKRRAYLDFILGFVSKKSERTWDYLYLRAFLRSGDFLALTLRLLALSLVVLFGIQVPWLAVAFVLVFNYLLLFQLLALYHVYDYQYLHLLYPLSQKMKVQGFQRLLRGILYVIVLLQILVALLVLTDKKYIGMLLAGTIFLNHVYLAIKAKKLID